MAVSRLVRAIVAVQGRWPEIDPVARQHAVGGVGAAGIGRTDARDWIIGPGSRDDAMVAPVTVTAREEIVTMRTGGFEPNLLDAVLVLLLVYVAIRGWRQGALSQIAAFGGFVLGLLAGVWAAPHVAGLFVDEPGPGLALITLGIVLVGMMIGQGAGFAVGLRLRRTAQRAGVGKVDRGVGVAVGAAGLVFVVWLLSSVLAQGPVPVLAQQIRGSQAVQAIHAALPPAPDVVGRVSAFLDDQGFPQVFAGPGGGGIAAPPVPATADEALRAAAAAGRPSTVQISTAGCGDVLGAGSGFVVQPGFVVTNAHVVAGFGRLAVRDAAGEHTAVAIHVDPALDLAVLSAPGVRAPAIDWAGEAISRGTEGATLGFPGGQREMVVRPATVRGRLDAVGRDIYGRGMVRREILALSASVEHGDSGGPFVTSDGRVGGVVFGGDPGDAGTGYALTAQEVRPVVEDAIVCDQEVGVGACRF